MPRPCRQTFPQIPSREMEKKGTSARPQPPAPAVFSLFREGLRAMRPLAWMRRFPYISGDYAEHPQFRAMRPFASSCPANILKGLARLAPSHIPSHSDFPKGHRIADAAHLAHGFFHHKTATAGRTQTNITSVLNQGETSLGFTSPKDAPALYSRSTSCGSSILTVEYTFWVFSEKLLCPLYPFGSHPSDRNK